MKKGLLQFLKKYFKKQKPPKKTAFLPEYDYEMLQMKQDWEDRKIERAARDTAFDMFQQTVTGYSIIIQKPVLSVIMEHYPLKSKYDSKSYNELVEKEFKKIKEEYGNLYKI